jgi:hypothetical protein
MINPRGTVTRSTTPKKGFAKIGEPQIEIAAWCPDENAALPPEQVHFIIYWPVKMADLPPLVLRFKGPDTIGFFIEELARYRKTVWPAAEPVVLEHKVQFLSESDPDLEMSANKFSALDDVIYRIRNHEATGMVAAENLAQLAEKELDKLRADLAKAQRHAKRWREYGERVHSTLTAKDAA